MQVFKAFLKVVRKNMFTALIFTGVFLTIAVMTAKNGNTNSAFEPVKIKLTVFDEDNSEESHALTEFLGKRYRMVETNNDEDDIMDMLYYEQVGCVIIIENGYSRKLADGETEGLFSTYHMHDSYDLVIIEQCLSDYAAAVRAYTVTGAPLSEAISSAAQDLSAETEVSVETFGGEGNDDYFAYYNYMPYIIISAFMSLLCPVLNIMERRDLRYRTNCSSVRPASYTVQLFIGCGAVVIVLWGIMVGVGAAIYGFGTGKNELLAILNSFVFALLSTAVSVFVASLTSSKNITTLITQAVGLGMSFFCGIFIPQDMLGDSVLAVGKFFPAYWYIRLNDMLRGARVYNAEKVVMCMGIQIAFAAAIVTVTVLIRRLRYNSVKAMA